MLQRHRTTEYQLAPHTPTPAETMTLVTVSAGVGGLSLVYIAGLSRRALPSGEGRAVAASRRAERRSCG